MVVIARFNPSDVISLKAAQVDDEKKHTKNEENMIMSSRNIGELPVTADGGEGRGEWSKFSFGITFCSFVYKSAYSLFPQIAQQCASKCNCGLRRVRRGVCRKRNPTRKLDQHLGHKLTGKPTRTPPKGFPFNPGVITSVLKLDMRA